MIHRNGNWMDCDWYLNGIRYRKDNEPDHITFRFEEKEKWIQVEKWVDPENGKPNRISYYKSNINDLKGPIQVEEWYHDVEDDSPNLIKYFKYRPEIMILLLDKYRHLMDEDLYRRNIAIYKKDANEIVEYRRSLRNNTSDLETKSNEETDRNEIIGYFKTFVDGREEEGTKISKPTKIPRYLRFYLEKEPDRKGFIEELKWFKNGNLDREGQPALITFRESGRVYIKKWMTNGRENRSPEYPAVVIYNFRGEIENELYFVNGNRVDPVDHNETDDEENEFQRTSLMDRDANIDENEIFEVVDPDN